MRWNDDAASLKVRLKPLVTRIRQFYGKVLAAMAKPYVRRLGPACVAVIVSFYVTRFPWFLRALVSYAVVSVLWENFLKVRPINQIIRYGTLLNILEAFRPFFTPYPKILETGSGPIGLGPHISYPFWGSDVKFGGFISPNMTPVTASATELPFENDGFDIVISIDCIEHIPTDALREKAIEEMWRVTKKILIVGYPSGRDAFYADKILCDYYQMKKRPVPRWLTEHLANGLPDKDLIETFWNDRSPIVVISQEPCRFHLWLMKREANPFWLYGFMLVLFVFGVEPLFRFLSRYLDHVKNPYRRIYVLTKDPELVTVVERSV